MAIWTDPFTGGPAATRGANWTSVTSFPDKARLDSNQALASSTTDPTMEYNNTVSPGPAQYSEMTLRDPMETGGDPVGQGVGPAIRMGAGGADQGYVAVATAHATTPGFRIAHRSGGTMTQKGSTYATAPVDGDRFRIEISTGHIITLLVNDVVRVTYDASSDGDLIATGNTGDYSAPFNEFVRWDDGEGGDLGPPPSPPMFRGS